MAFKLGMTVDIYSCIYAQGHFDYLDLDARSQWFGRGEIQRWISSTTPVSHDREFENICMVWPYCFVLWSDLVFWWLFHKTHRCEHNKSKLCKRFQANMSKNIHTFLLLYKKSSEQLKLTTACENVENHCLCHYFGACVVSQLWS